MPVNRLLWISMVFLAGLAASTVGVLATLRGGSLAGMHGEPARLGVVRSLAAAPKPVS